MAFQGRVVFFKLYNVWDPEPLALGAGPAWIIGALFYTVGLSALVLVVQNVKSGRFDLRGATRLVLAVGGVTLVGGLLASRFSSVEELDSVPTLIGWAAFVSLLTWLFYAAVEPHVRRRWPSMLITWARLMEGRWRDPLLGRDLLIGALVGAVVELGDLARLLPENVTLAMHPSWIYPSAAVSAFLGRATSSLMLGLGLVVILVLCRIVLRSERKAAAGLFLAMFSLQWLVVTFQGQADVVNFLFEVTKFAALVVVTIRYGLVALLGTIWFGMGANWILPYGVTSAVVTHAALLVLPAVFGFYTATRGRASANWLEG